MKTITLDEFQNRIRDAVLAALDESVRELLDHEKARGWTDAELPALFAGLDAHAKAVAKRINDGNEPGSVAVSIKPE